MTSNLTYDEFHAEGQVFRTSLDALLLARRGVEIDRLSWNLLPPGSRVRHAEYQLLVGTVRSLDLSDETTVPYHIDWRDPGHAALALGVDYDRCHPSKIRSYEEGVS